jgi:competence protein ComEA
MDEAGRRAGAALGLAAALFAAALARREPPAADCPAPRERRAEAGHTVELACRPGAGGGELRGPARRLVGLAIDPNRADAATLESLPGIGPGRAAAIVAARRQRPFTSLADLGRVRGIGPATLARLRGLVAVAEGDFGLPAPDPVGCPGACEQARPLGEP